MSHYSQLALYPLFPLMHDDYGVGYAALGLIVTILNTSGADSTDPDRIFGRSYGRRKGF